MNDGKDSKINVFEFFVDSSSGCMAEVVRHEIPDTEWFLLGQLMSQVILEFGNQMSCNS